MIMAMTVSGSVSVREAKRMLKIVAKLVVGLAKALACAHGHLPQTVADGYWEARATIGKVPQLGSAVSPTITASATSLLLEVSIMLTQHSIG